MTPSKWKLINLCFLLFIIHCGAYGQKKLSFSSLSIEDGLSQNTVLSITQDKQHFLWFATNHGLNRYDGYQFKVYTSDTTNPESISGNVVTAVLTDSEGILWVGTNNGLNRYDRYKDAFVRISGNPGSGSGLYGNSIENIYEDREKKLWVCTSYGLNLLTDRHRNKFRRFIFKNPKANYSLNQIYAVFRDTDHNLWVGTFNGLLCVTNKNGKLSYRLYKHDPKNIHSISSNYITTINADAWQNLWVGTDNGLNVYNKSDQSFTAFKHSNKDPNSIIHNDIREITPDKKGLLWISTQEGLSILDPVNKKFNNYQHDPELKNSLSHNSIHGIFQDITGNMWLGTYYGGVNVVYPYSTLFQVYQNSRIHPSISSNVISSIVEDNHQNLWIGTEGGGLNYFDRKNNTYKYFKISPDSDEGPSSNLIKTIFKAKNGDLLIGTHHGGLNIFNPSTEKFQHVTNINVNSGATSTAEIIAINEDSYGNILVGSHAGLTTLKKINGRYADRTVASDLEKHLKDKRINVLLEDKHKKLWIGTTKGLYTYDSGQKKLLQFAIKEGDSNALSSASINCIIQLTNGYMAIGSYYGGLSVYNPEKGTSRIYNEKNGLSNNNVLGIIEDKNNLWISTDNGLSKLDLATGIFRNYTKSDGLAGNDFNIRSFLKDSKGQLFFGGHNGLTSFYPDQIQINNQIASIVFTGLKLFNETVEVNGQDKLLSENINTTKKITFKHDQNHFTIGFALLNYIKSDKNRYIYKLSGYDKEWNEVNTPSATYTNLPAGEYSFTVKGVNNDGIAGGIPAMIKIEILPPIWASWWAYTLYILIFSVILFLTVRYLFVRALLKRSEDVQRMKLNFFTHISHEIRTPLTLILGPLESLLKNTQNNLEINKQVIPIKNNADRLMRLITELMDFRKAESGHLKLNVSKSNIVSFVDEIFMAFSHEATTRNITYTLTSDQEIIELYFDKNQLEKVLFNLLSNAFKFTNDNGQISLSIQELDQQNVEIKVKDNGKGIPYESQNKLFSDFFQVDESGSSHIGSGIGLALSKSIVEAHKGKITISSSPATALQNGDTCFTVILTKGRAQFKNSQLTEPINELNNSIYVSGPHLIPEASNDIPLSNETVLVIEDNAEIRQLISSFIGKYYQTETSVDGMDGWETAIELLPDLIICDVMMPGIDGLELCRRLKTDERTCHIPIVLLTARSSHIHQVSGFETGADAYITKPFNLDLLQLNVRNLLLSRATMRQKYSQEINLQPQNITVNTTDHTFITKVISHIEAQMSNQEFGVPELAVEIGMSQPVLYKKIRAITDLSVNDFIKSIRLKKAAQLLEQGTYNVSEISYMIGFNDPKYFSREFKKQYGETPRIFVANIITHSEKPQNKTTI